jgi:c-di-AMP phosphodiesterase-like protein
MALPTISFKDFLNLFPKNRIMDTLPLIKVELIVEINFDTFGQVKYSDEDGRPWIKEFIGSKWSKVMYLKKYKEIEFSIFINNQFLQKERKFILVKKLDEKVTDQKEFPLCDDKLYEGWFKLC